MTTVEGLLIALVLVFGTIALGFVTVTMSDSRQASALRSEVTDTQSWTAAMSSSIVNQTSLPPVNQTKSGQHTGASSPETAFVSILPGSGDQFQISFSPEPVTVVIGVNNTVSWVNNDNAPHTVTANDGSFGSGNIGAGGTYTYTFTTPGTYKYYCAYHTWMVGTVIVKGW